MLFKENNQWQAGMEQAGTKQSYCYNLLLKKVDCFHIARLSQEFNTETCSLCIYVLNIRSNKGRESHRQTDEFKISILKSLLC